MNRFRNTQTDKIPTKTAQQDKIPPIVGVLSIDDPEAGLEPSNSEYLDLLEQEVADSATEVLNGLSTPAEREEFERSLFEYEYTLNETARELTDTMLENGYSDTEVRNSLIDMLIGSKADIVATTAFQHAEDSMIERARQSVTENRRRRFAGKLAVGTAMGGSVYLATRGLDNVFDGASGAVSVLTFLKGPAMLKAAVSAGSEHIKKLGISSVDKHDAQALQSILGEVSAIDDPKERELVKHRLLTEKFHIRDLEKELWLTLGPQDITSDKMRTDMITQGAQMVVESLRAFYEVDNADKTPRELLEKTAKKVVKSTAGNGVTGVVVKGAVDAAS